MSNELDKPKILIVDDLDKNLFALEMMLENIDVQVIKAQSGNEALSKTLYHDFALALIDVQMPEMTGYELAEYLRKENNTQEIPIIFITAMDRNEQHMFKGYEKGAVEFLFKPIQENILLSKISVFLDLYRRRKNLEIEIEKRKKIENELIKAKEKAEEASRIKSQFLANMSHDFRTPLHVIIGLIDKLSQIEDQKSQLQDLNQSLGILGRSSERLLALVNDILDISKIESGKLTFVLEAFSVDQLTCDYKTMMATLLESKPVNFNLIIEKDHLICSDKNRINQVLTNLLGNASKFIEKGDISLKIYTKDKNLYFEVTDSGIGIKKLELDTVFQAFSQIDSRVARKHKGTGLGLSICQGFIKKLGGDIWVESDYGKGSKFTFFVPMNKDKIKSQDQISEKIVKMDFSKKFKNKSVLLCDDDEFNLAFAGMIFSGQLTHDLVSNGFEAIKKAKNKKYDIIFLDINMPEISGTETLDHLQEFVKDTPIVALTAYNLPETREALLSQGFSHYFTKPFKEKDLLSFCNSIL